MPIIIMLTFYKWFCALIRLMKRFTFYTHKKDAVNIHGVSSKLLKMTQIITFSSTNGNIFIIFQITQRVQL